MKTIMLLILVIFAGCKGDWDETFSSFDDDCRILAECLETDYRVSFDDSGKGATCTIVREGEGSFPVQNKNFPSSEAFTPFRETIKVCQIAKRKGYYSKENLKRVKKLSDAYDKCLKNLGDNSKEAKHICWIKVSK